MTIECTQRNLYGLIVKTREVAPGTVEKLDYLSLIPHSENIITSSIYIESDDSVIIRSHGLHDKLDENPPVKNEERLAKDTINAKGVIGHRPLDIFFGNSTIYTWKPTVKK